MDETLFKINVPSLQPLLQLDGFLDRLQQVWLYALLARGVLRLFKSSFVTYLIGVLGTYVYTQGK